MFFFLFGILSLSWGKCEICKLVADTISQSLAQGIDESQIKQKVQEKCKVLAFLSDICEMIVDSYYSKLMTFLRGGQSSTAACKAIGACGINAQESNGLKRRVVNGIVAPHFPHKLRKLHKVPRHFHKAQRLVKPATRYAHRFYPKVHETNGAPQFQTETSPTWSQSWEEQI
ncbi:saposin B type domain family [Trichomonas vaginalis G3]|uniref:saposin B type domain family n=1 Tax=Trichomonas vaginalis (strain ATCC PRA-98 / G3) TaxID=412133 RepID=UPI0021E55D5C|nr:saposin B type domain family [Trichomonas vaginalis G3]KAI5542036.1 saposin B type domain family [Trichomonas vaginalis G3]